jgi:hypothetical protein
MILNIRCAEIRDDLKMRRHGANAETAKLPLALVKRNIDVAG